MSAPYQFLPPLTDAESLAHERQWLLEHGVRNLHSLTAPLLRQTGLEFCAFNPAASGAGAKALHPGTWVLAYVHASTERGFWWVATIEMGTSVITTYPVANPARHVIPLLERMGVADATRFRATEVEPAATCPWRPVDPSSRPDTRTVYFIRAEGTELIKIGVTGDVESRLRSLRTGSPVPLTLVATIPGVGQSSESELHRRFAHARSHGEWFRATPDLLDYIAANGVRS